MSEWDEAHAAVQVELQRLVDMISMASPPVHPGAGRTSGKAFHLFSYRTFEPLHDADAEPIVVGVDFSPTGDQVVVRGDISGEETGQVYYSTSAERIVPRTRDALVAAARETAGALGRQANLLRQLLAGKAPAGAE